MPGARPITDDMDSLQSADARYQEAARLAQAGQAVAARAAALEVVRSWIEGRQSR